MAARSALPRPALRIATRCAIRFPRRKTTRRHSSSVPGCGRFTLVAGAKGGHARRVPRSRCCASERAGKPAAAPGKAAQAPERSLPGSGIVPWMRERLPLSSSASSSSRCGSRIHADFAAEAGTRLEAGVDGPARRSTEGRARPQASTRPYCRATRLEGAFGRRPASPPDRQARSWFWFWPAIAVAGTESRRVRLQVSRAGTSRSCSLPPLEIGLRRNGCARDRGRVGVALEVVLLLLRREREHSLLCVRALLRIT